MIVVLTGEGLEVMMMPLNVAATVVTLVVVRHLLENLPKSVTHKSELFPLDGIRSLGSLQRGLDSPRGGVNTFSSFLELPWIPASSPGLCWDIRPHKE